MCYVRSFQTETALNELSNSPVVEKCLQAVPRGGISAEIITDKSNLSKKALHTLSRWARVVVDVKEDGYESGYDDDPVEVLLALSWSLFLNFRAKFCWLIRGFEKVVQ